MGYFVSSWYPMNVLTIDSSVLGYRFNAELAGVVCEIETNYRCLQSTLCRWPPGRPNSPEVDKLSMQIFVAPGSARPARRPHFRGLHHVVVASFGHANAFVIDLLRRRICARISEGGARDSRFWNEILAPIAIGVVGPTVGVAPIHCACLSRDGNGLLVAGVSGAGKSTLCIALVQAGYDYVSDDWTYLAEGQDGLIAQGLESRVKLLPDAKAHFSWLTNCPLTTSLNGEVAYEPPASSFGGRVLRSCKPRWCIFLDRLPGSQNRFAPLGGDEARLRFQSGLEPLPLQLSTASKRRAEILEHIAHLPSWTFRYGSNPHLAAQDILSFVSSQTQQVMAWA